MLPRSRATVSVVLTASLVGAVAAGCTIGPDGTDSASGGTGADAGPPVALTANVADDARDVGVDTLVSATARDGEVLRAVLRSDDGSDRVPGTVDDGRWTAAERLEPGTRYRLWVTGRGGDGVERTLASSFTTQPLTLDQQTYPAVAPLEGETVGVGMPIIVTFDVPVKDRKLFEEHMSVTSSTPVEGSWSWFSDSEVHYRPASYWPSGTKVNVSLKLNGLPAGDGVFGQQDQDIDFTVGREAVSIVDIAKHELRFTVDGKTVRTIPVSTGDDTHRTRRGTKVVMEKFSSVDMDAATTGVDSEDPGYYNISDVRWAMRLTNSGEFIHAAPWSVASQGNANVSHGCTGMSTENAKWLYDQSRRGDVVRFVNSPRTLEDRNGWTDWNVPWSEWTKGSALADDAPA